LSSAGFIAARLGVAERRTERRDYLASRRQDAKSGERSALEHQRSVHQNLEPAVRRTDHSDIRFELTSHSRRHTDGVESRNSVGAGSNLNSGHMG
jgi:hypothetical protein